MTDDYLRKYCGLREKDPNGWEGFSGKIVGHDGDVEVIYEDGTRKLFPSERQRNGATEDATKIDQEASSASPSPTCSPSSFVIPEGYEPKCIKEDRVVWDLLWKHSEGQDSSLLKEVGEDVRVVSGS